MAETVHIKEDQETESRRPAMLAHIWGLLILVNYIHCGTSCVCSEVYFDLMGDSKSSQVDTEDERSHHTGTSRENE